MQMLKTVMMKSAGVRRPGSAALDLAYVAAGRVDAFWEIGLSAWDTAAGTLLNDTAGGVIGHQVGKHSVKCSNHGYYYKHGRRYHY